MKLNDICELIVDCPHSTAKDEGSGYPLIRTPNIGRGRLILDDVHRVSKEVYDKRNARAVPQDDDLILAREAPAGNVAIIKNGEKVCLGQRTVLIRPDKNKVYPDFLAYFILAPEQQYELLGTANGATVAHVNIPVIKALPVELPEMEQQIKAAGVLKAYDDLIENNQCQIKLLEEAAQRLYKEWFIDLRFPGHEDVEIVNGVPRGWKKQFLGDVLDVVRGRSYSSKELSESDGVLMVNLSNIRSFGGYNREQEKHYDELSEAEKEEYEATFTDADGNLPEAINPSALNEWVFNEDTIREVLNILMTQGLRVRYGEQLGKTIIFAKNHAHAEKILEIFYREYPSLVGYAKVIDNYMTYAQSAIDEFSEGDKLPRIAISVDMLDTGIDVPEILNLVFFKKVMSKAKFWQMIGRGTRLCPGLLDGEDKRCFYIFDFCGNFEFFRMHKQGRENASGLTLQGAIFKIKAQLAFKLQDEAFQTAELMAFREGLVADLLGKVQALNRDNWAVKLHLQAVEQFSAPERYAALTYPDTVVMAEELAPLVLPDRDDASAVRFDALLHGIELALLEGQKYPRARNDLLRRVKALSGVANIPEIMAQSALMHKLLHEDYLDNANISQLEDIRENLRSLMKYLPRDGEVYQTHFNDDILTMDWHDSDLESDDLGNYRAKAEFYVRQHPDHLVIHKLRTNQPLTETDVQTLEGILWSEVGTQQDYEAAFGRKPLGEFVREIVGLDMNAAKEAFSRYLDDTRLDSRQIYFVNQIVEYIVHNGVMKDLSVLQEPPFTDRGSIVDIFRDVSVWMGIREVIDSINENAAIG